MARRKPTIHGNKRGKRFGGKRHGPSSSGLSGDAILEGMGIQNTVHRPDPIRPHRVETRSPGPVERGISRGKMPAAKGPPGRPSHPDGGPAETTIR